MTQHIAEVAFVVCGGLAIALGSFLIGRKWRKQYQHGISEMHSLQQLRNQTAASAVAEASGNRVDIHMGHHAELAAGNGELYLPSAVRARLDRGTARGEASLAHGDDTRVSVPVELYRPTRLSRVLFGPGRSRPRDHDGGELRTPSDEE